MSWIYLDNAATTRLAPELASELAVHQATHFANPATRHPLGRKAGKLLEAARASLAQGLGAQPDELIFTGGGTESLYLAILGSAGTSDGGHIAISAVEHSAVVEAARVLEAQRGFTVDVIPVDAEARVSPEAVARRVGPRTRVVAVMAANNEVGTLNDIPAIARAVRREAPRARLIVDAVQAFGKAPIDLDAMDADCVAVTGHKLHGPKGIGALWSRTTLLPVFKGGGQEKGVRGGTQSAPLAWAFAQAATAHLEHMPRITELRDRLLEGLRGRVDGLSLTGVAPGPDRLGNNCHVLVPGLPGEPLLNALSASGVCASSGSACSGQRFSKVLTAMGRRQKEGAFIRLSLGRLNTEADIDEAIDRFAAAVADVRKFYD